MTGRSVPLRRRLAAVVAAAAALVIILTGVASLLGLRESLLHQVDIRLERVTSAPAFDGPGGGPPGGGEDLNPLNLPGQEVGTVLLRDQSDSGIVTDQFAVGELSEAQAAALRNTPADSRPRTVRLPDLGSHRVVAWNDASGTSVTGIPLSSVNATLRAAAIRQALIGLAGLAVISTLCAWLIRRELRPLNEVAEVARSVSATPLDRGEVQLTSRSRIDDTATEVGQVGHALNTLISHVEDSLRARHASEQQVRNFVADASHELRTPLASVAGYTELLRTHDLSPEDSAAALGRISAESRRMADLVEDLLLLARIDAGRAEQSTLVDLGQVAADAVMDAHATGPDHRFELDIPLDEADQAPDFLVSGNEARLRQVMGNLLTNARIHTPVGTVTTVSVRAEDTEILVTVSDNGPGIPADLLPRVFDRFSRGDASRQRTSGTSGLGLSIVAAIVRAHGGTITAASDHGACFTLRFPRAHLPASTGH